MFSAYNYNTPVTTTATAATSSSFSTWRIVAVVIAVNGGICIYFCFLTKDNEEKLTGFAKWLYDFLSFKKLFAEALLKITYLIFAIMVTLFSLSLISTSFVGFLILLVAGNVVLRLVYEFGLATLLICSNVSAINSKMKKQVAVKEVEVEEKKEKAVKSKKEDSEEEK